MPLRHVLSKKDTVCLLELIHECLHSTQEKDLIEIANRLKHLISYDFAICGVATAVSNKIESYKILNITYPVEWLELYGMRKYYRIDPIVKDNFTNFRLQYWADTYKKHSPPADFLSLAENYGLKNGYTHGVMSPKGRQGGLFSIAGKSVEHHNRTEVILKYIVPHFHQALFRILDQNREKQNISLSSREKEVLKWIKEGKISWDISVILGISERTVNFHVSNIKQKLDAVSRVQAVAIAIGQGLIDIE